MSSSGYYIEHSKKAGRQTILQEDSDLRIDVYDLRLTHFTPDEEMMHLYGNGRKWLAFQCEMVIIPEETELISDAIRWYTTQIKEPGMELTLRDPRV